MTEVWGDPLQNFEVEDFSYFELLRAERKQSCTRNSGGIIIYVRNDLVSEETLFGKRDDTHIWLRLKHELFNFDNDLFFIIISLTRWHFRAKARPVVEKTFTT